MTIPAPEANMTAVCGTCGAVYWAADGHSCSKAAPCSGCADLQRQLEEIRQEIASLDRGLISATEAADRARVTAERLEGHVTAQDKAWKIWREARDVIEAAGAGRTAPQPRQRRSSRPRPSRPRTGAPSLRSVPTGGAA